MFCDPSLHKWPPDGAKASSFKLNCNHHVDMDRLVSCSAHVSGGQKSTVYDSTVVFVLDDAALIVKICLI